MSPVGTPGFLLRVFLAEQAQLPHLDGLVASQRRLLVVGFFSCAWLGYLAFKQAVK